MPILQEIFSWSKGLAHWLSDAIARFFAKEKLASEDMDDLYSLLKSEHGILDPKGRTPNPIADDKIPTGTQPNVLVELVATKNLVNVNVITENQRLQFGVACLTVIYGDN